MKSTLLAALFALFALAGCNGSSGASSQIATVDITRITANWPKFINYNNQLAADTDAINRSSASQRDKQHQIDGLRRRFVSMQDEVTNDVRTAAAQVASDRHFKLVVTREFTGYGGVDITADVEKLLKITEKSPPPN
jgi:Skp family chaperone for outer membrane proteins